MGLCWGCILLRGHCWRSWVVALEFAGSIGVGLNDIIDY